MKPPNGLHFDNVMEAPRQYWQEDMVSTKMAAQQPILAKERAHN